MIQVQVPFMRYMGRWIVMFDRDVRRWITWKGGSYETMRRFPTHAEAMAYADKAARS